MTALAGRRRLHSVLSGRKSSAPSTNNAHGHGSELSCPADSNPKGPAPVAARLAAIVPGMLKCPDLVARFEETQTLPRNPGLMGDAFVSMMRTQLDSWRSVARAANIEITT
jgi:hypothetical protein